MNGEKILDGRKTKVMLEALLCIII